MNTDLVKEFRNIPIFADLTDEELREALQTTIVRMLRVPSGPRE